MALAGGLVAMRLKIPAGAMVGSMIAVGIFNVIVGKAYFPTSAKIMTQMISGLFIGCKITRNEIAGLRKAIKPAILNTVVLLLCCLAMGAIMYFFTDYSLATCAFACAPGSMVDMSIIAMDMEADTSVVSVLQLVRLLSILGLFPTLFRVVIGKVGGDKPQAEERLPENTGSAPPAHTPRNMVLTLAVAIVCGLAGSVSGVPAGTLIFALLGVSVQNVLTNTAYMPIRLKQFAQVCAGALIGESVTGDALVQLRFAIVPALIMIVCLLAIVLVLSYFLYRCSDLDFSTALFACAPGGASDLALIAEDFGANTPKISIIQYMRVICVVVFYPSAIQLLQSVLT